MRRTLGTVVGAVLVWAVAVSSASAQFFGRGATVQGDILRGEGAFLFGAGYYNVNTAIAGRINTETDILWNEYIWNVAKNENHQNAVFRANEIAKDKENFEKRRKQVAEDPNNSDVMSGTALNATLLDLLKPHNLTNVRHGTQVPLKADTVRRIPFKFAELGQSFSMERLSVKGKNKWPVGLRGPEFDAERRAYERAFDAALDELLDGKGKLQRPSIQKVESALRDLRAKLDEAVPQHESKIFIDARDFLKRLEAAKDLFKSKKTEDILAAIDKFAGTTVKDLLEFMDKYNLGFAVPDLGEERGLYLELYAALQQQRDRATGIEK